MIDQLSFDLAQATAQASIGMDNADRAERVQMWKQGADYWLSMLPAGSTLIADDLVRAIGLPDEGPARNNVVGAWFSAQSRLGTLTFAGRLTKSERVIGHRNLQRVWIKT